MRFYKILLLLVCMLAVLACSLKDKSDDRYKPIYGGPEELAKPSPSYERDMEASKITGPSVRSQSGLKAGYADDNAQFNHYLEFLEKFKDIPQIDFPVHERIVFEIKDADDKSLPDARIEVSQSGKTLMKASAYANGQTLFFPSEYPDVENYKISVSYGNVTKNFHTVRGAERLQSYELPVRRSISGNVPVDIVFILDTTGSMGEEIARLKSTLLIIHDNLTASNIPVDIRFGMVMYKDKGDAYITKTVPFTADAEAFQKTISRIEAFGGGDDPEDMQSALEVSMKDMKWRDKGVKMAFLITDASAHIDYGQQFTLLESSRLAREKGIKIFSVGTGGLAVDGEINLRQIAQYTMGKYIFLTYGERGESDGGEPGSVSHHTGANFVSDKLEAVIIRFAKEEIGDYALKPLDEGEDYFEAVKGGDDNLKILKELFSSMVNQLASYSGMNIPQDTPVAVIPLSAGKALEANAEYFTEQLYFAAAEYKGFKSVERKDLQKILNEIQFTLSGLVSDEDMLKLGDITGAKLLITGSVYEKDDNYEVYLKLLRVENGEVLSVTRAKIEKALGIK